MPWSLNPGLPIHLHRSGLEECDSEVGTLGNADSRAQPALYLPLGRGKDEFSRTHETPQGHTYQPTGAHHMDNTCHAHHLQQSIIHAWLLKLCIAVRAPQVSPRAPAGPRG